jgi:GT2 family glycosyltransferase
MDVPARVKVVDTGSGARPRASLQLVARHLEAMGADLEWLTIGERGLPRRAGRSIKRTWKSFAATPPALMESWRVARHLDVATNPGDTILISDHQGSGGVFTLEQAALSADERVNVLVVAADGAALEYLAVTGTIDGAPPEIEHAIDCEHTSYRWASAVLATSAFAARYLTSRGLETSLAVPIEEAAFNPDRAPRNIELPEPVSRIAHTPEMLRAISGLLDDPEVTVRVSGESHRDRIWTGTTWDALSHLVPVFGDRLRRGPPVGRPDAVVLGDVFSAPGERVTELRQAGVPVAVYRDSTAAACWPEVPTWGDEDELAGLLGGPLRSRRVTPPERPIALRTTPSAPERARRVSVAVPIFREVSYLDECVRSILGQTQLPHELFLVDDGSRSEEVNVAIERWVEKEPDLIKPLRLANRGVSVARNTAIDAMTGDAFVLVDSDDALDPEFIAATTEAMRVNPELWAVATWTEFFGQYDGIEAKPPFTRRVGMRENPIVSTAVLLDMKVRDAGIRFAPDLAFMFCEDWDVWAKIVAAGGEIGLIPRPLARHRVRQTSGGYQRTTLAHALGKARATRPLREMSGS